MDQGELIGNVVVLAIFGFTLMVAVGIAVWLAYLLSRSLQLLPPEYRQLEPWQPYLLLIPCLNLIWNFITYIQVASSYEAYFASRGEPIDGNLKTFGVVYCILAVLSAIPYLGGCFGLVSLGFLIAYHVQLSGLRDRVRLGGDWDASTFR